MLTTHFNGKKESAGSDRSFNFFCEDFADGEVKPGTYAIRFRDHATAQEFKKHFDEARVSNATYIFIHMVHS